MSNLDIQVIAAQTEDNLTGIVIDGVPHLYWLRVYQALGIRKEHAPKIISRLTEGKHYRKFTNAEFALLSGTVDVTATVYMGARSFVFLTAEGYNRAIMEITESRLNDHEVAAAINAKKDLMASIYTRYQKGEVLSIAVDEAKKELPGEVNAAIIIDENLAIAESFIKRVCPLLKIDPGLVTSTCLTHAEQEIQKQGGSASLTYLKSMIPRLLSGDPGTLTPSQIGHHFCLPAIRVNEVLEKLGYQTSSHRKSETSGLLHKEWAPTPKGEPHGEWKPVSVGHRNGSIHNGYKWYWKPSIIDEFRIGIFGEVHNMGQTTLAATAGGA